MGAYYAAPFASPTLPMSDAVNPPTLPPHLTLRAEFASRTQDTRPGAQGTSERPITREERNTQGGAGTQQTPGGGAAPQGPQSCGDTLMSQLPFLAIMIAIFYFLLIRPQQKQEKARREMLSAIQKGDRVVTASGIHGRIAQLDEQTVSLNLDVEGKIRVTFDRAAIARVVRDAEAEGKGKAGGS